MKHLFGLCLLMALISCKKEDHKIPEVASSSSSPSPSSPSSPPAEPVPAGIFYDTIKPLPYYPAYPGSYWVYYNEITKDTTIRKVEPNYKLDIFLRPWKDTYIRDSAYVPFIGTSGIWGSRIHSVHTENGHQVHTLEYLVSDSLTQSFRISYPVVSHMYSYYTFLTKDTSVTLANTSYSPVVIMAVYGAMSPSQPSLKWRYFYAKDIGFVGSELLGSNYDRLVRYHINN